MLLLAMDCEMVGSGNRSILARVSIVDIHGFVVFDEYVKPTALVTDYRTAVSGIRREDLVNAESFESVQRKVKMLLKNNILVGHTMHYDFNALKFRHPPLLTRDLTNFSIFKNGTYKISLKNLAKKFLGINIQDGEHSSIEDARAAMDLYLLVAKQWEKASQLSNQQKQQKL